MSLYYLSLWSQVDILQKLFKKYHVHMRLWTRFYGILAQNHLLFFAYRAARHLQRLTFSTTFGVHATSWEALV